MNSIIAYFNTLPDALLYFSLALASFLENLIPPIPGDMTIVFGGFLVGTGRLHFLSVFITTTFGSMLGFICMYWIGAAIGRRSFLKRDHILFKRRHIIRVEDWFRKYGFFIILINRFLPGIRSVISITAGISGLNTLKVLIISLISGALWNIVWIFMGFTIGNKWNVVEEDISFIFARYNMAIYILLFLFILFWIIRGLVMKRRSQKSIES